MADIKIHPMAPEFLPGFIASADGSDHLFNVMIFITIAAILLIGVFYLTLHAMPERMAHDSNHSQMQVVGILALLALFTHNNLFWVAAIMIAAFRMPDFLTPLNSIAASLEAANRRAGVDPISPPPANSENATKREDEA